jgi:hypothetical protein
MQNLTKLLGDLAHGCCKEQKVENYFGRKVAIDASMHIYQFLVGTRFQHARKFKYNGLCVHEKGLMSSA